MPTQPSVNLSKSEKRTLGAFFTPSEAASLMAQWVVAHRPESILEPSFGDGVFLRAIEDAARRKRRKPHLGGAELMSAAFDAAHASLSLTIDGHAGDFLSLPTRPVDAA
ncbi:MAG: N-6 DNA methylase, partial [Acidimicrobiales bacterium]